IRLAENLLAPESSNQPDALRQSLFALAEDKNPRVRCQLALTLGGMGGGQQLPVLSRLAQAGPVDHWQSLAILSSAGPRPSGLWKTLQKSNWINGQDEERPWFADKLAALVASGADEEDLRESAAVLEQDTLPAFGKMVLLSNLLEAQKANPLIRQLLFSQDLDRNAARIVAQAERVALSPEGPLPARLVAIRLLGLRPSAGTHLLPRLLLPENPPEVQSAAVNALADGNEPVAAGFALGGWERY